MIKRNVNNALKLMILFSGILFAQNTESMKTGEVTYLSSQNVYVRFDNTEGINEGDTLYSNYNSKLFPCIVVKYLSSSSIAGINICNDKLEKGTKVFAVSKQKTEINNIVIDKDNLDTEKEIFVESENNNETNEVNLESELKGRLSVSSYSNLTNLGSKNDYQRWRYLFSLSAKNISGLPISFNNYITFSYRADKWTNTRENIGRALRIYELSFDYDLSYKSKISIGRKNNPRISNLGSMDGLQFNTKLGNFESGFVVGSRPNFSDYGYNLKMFQYGVYISRTDTVWNGTIQNTIGGFEQTNDFNTDRRFIYLQHINNSIKKINIFASSEIDLYKKKSGVSENTFSLTSLYLSLRFSPSRYFSISTSYDARKNVIYYETSKNYADSLLESETRQGLRLSANIRPLNYLSIGINYGYRFRNSDIQSTNNYGGYISYTNLPFIKSSLNVSYNKLNTSYLNGSIISVRIYKYLIPGFLNTGISYKKVNYDYKASTYSLDQNIYNLDLTFHLMSKIFLSANFEGTYEDVRAYNRVYINLTWRF